MEDFDVDSDYGADNIYLDCNNDSDFFGSIGDADLDRAIWTDTALEALVAIMHEINRQGKTFTSQREKFQYVTDKLSARGHNFDVSHIQNKCKHLRRVLKPRKELNDTINAEFHAFESNSSGKNPEPPAKKIKYEVDADDLSSLNSGSSFTWGEDATKLLLTLLRESKPHMGSSPILPNKKSMWEYISSQMIDMGYQFEPLQIENKWKTLVRTYRRRVEKRQTKAPECATTVSDSSFGMPSSMTTHPPPVEIATSDSWNPTDLIDPENNITEVIFSPGNHDIDTHDFICEDPEPYEEPANQEKVSPCDREPSPEICVDPEAGSIAQEIGLFRKQNFKFETERLKLQKAQMELYRERTNEISKLGSSLIELIKNLKK